MVHALPHPGRSHDHTPLDRERILTSVGAIAFHAVLLMLLLIPITAPQLLPRAIRPDVIIVDPIEPKPVPPVPVLPERPKPQPPQITRPVEQVRPMPPTFEPVVAPMEFDIAVEAVAEAPSRTGEGSPNRSVQEPATGAALRYARAPAPPYPRDALRAGISGTVLLEVLVDVDGRPLEVDIARSSGNRELDSAARRQVLRHWLFEPAIRGGQAVQARGLVPIEFSLE